jgi:hypothetical protein
MTPSAVGLARPRAPARPSARAFKGKSNDFTSIRQQYRKYTTKNQQMIKHLTK